MYLYDVCTQGCNDCRNAKRERDFLLTLSDKLEKLLVGLAEAVEDRGIQFVGKSGVKNHSTRYECCDMKSAR